MTEVLASPAIDPPKRRSGLSKSKIAIFEQCAKRLWLASHRPELADESDATKRVFRIGHDVGAVACALYPDGLMIDGSGGLSEAARVTAAALEAPDRRPLFEATFIHRGVVVRVDLLLPEEGGWHVVEVKSSTGVRDYHRADLATQLWVMRGCDVPVTRASIRVINTSFVLRETGDYRGLLRDEPAGVEVSEIVDGRTAVVTAAVALLDGSEPHIAIGPHCTDPFFCSFDRYCRRDLPPPPAWPTTLLPGASGKALARKLGETGIDDLLQVPAEDVAPPLLARIHHATPSGQPYHDADAVRRETADWSYPRTFLDFETITFAVPRWTGSRPYQQIPFQFSAHIDRGDGQLDHVEFLSIDGGDPRSACAAALAQLPSEGAVIAWNAPFERSCLLNLAMHAPDHAEALYSLAGRLVDLLPVAKRHYYHRDMRGSWSIKAVLPTLTPDLDYANLDGPQSGVEAQDAYLEAIDPLSAEERRESLRRGMLDYCRLDTLAMVIALERLSQRT